MLVTFARPTGADPVAAATPPSGEDPYTWAADALSMRGSSSKIIPVWMPATHERAHAHPRSTELPGHDHFTQSLSGSFYAIKPTHQIKDALISAKMFDALRDMIAWTQGNADLYKDDGDVDPSAPSQKEIWQALANGARAEFTATFTSMVHAEKQDAGRKKLVGTPLDRRVDHLEGLLVALPVLNSMLTSEDRGGGHSAGHPLDNNSLYAALETAVADGSRTTWAPAPAKKRAFLRKTKDYFREQVSSVPRYEKLPAGSRSSLRWAPLMLRHQVGGVPGEPQEKLPGWDFPRDVRGDTTTALLVNKALVRSYVPLVSAQGDLSIVRDRVWPIYKACIEEAESVKEQITKPPFTDEPVEMRMKRTRQLYDHLAATLERYDVEVDHCRTTWHDLFGRLIEGKDKGADTLTDDEKAFWRHLHARTMVSESEAAMAGRAIIRSAAKALEPSSAHYKNKVLEDAVQAKMDREHHEWERRLEATASDGVRTVGPGGMHTLQKLASDISFTQASDVDDGNSDASSETLKAESDTVQDHAKMYADSVGESTSGIRTDNTSPEIKTQVVVDSEDAPELNKGRLTVDNGNLSPMSISGRTRDEVTAPDETSERGVVTPESHDPGVRSAIGDSSCREDPFDWDELGDRISITHDALRTIRFGDFNSRAEFRRRDVPREADDHDDTAT